MNSPRVELLAVGEGSGVVHGQHVAALRFAGAVVGLVDDVDLEVRGSFTVHGGDGQKTRH